MLEQIPLSEILFLDIETVSQHSTFNELDETFRDLWQHKAAGILKKPKDELKLEELAVSYPKRAAIYAEFGKIICISVGYLYEDNGTWRARLKSFADDDEAVVLQQFSQLLQKRYPIPNRHFLCGHNIKEFDIPYICRRMVVHSLELPTLLQIHGKKPWELTYFLDTMELWKFGDYKGYTSLKLLAAVLGFPSPKEDIDGSEVGKVYWQERDLPRIATYCERDVLAVIQLLMRYRRMPILEAAQIEHR
ncbi:MAG: 3'-5' exonuclease [Saprospiraceae bacterium]|nr:3'-5' exonuclease [Saprospiraceae bacterium]MBP7680036.1 3'-5' exonuclease [Saprospiraceae bacterium]